MAFTELVSTAVANADARGELIASRARVLPAGDEARRRVVRDLHDGPQQRLVHTVITLKLAERAAGQDDEEAWALVAEGRSHAEHATAELRELAHGLIPPVLVRGGLAAGVDTLVSRLRLPVSAAVDADRVAADIEASAYFVITEALTNVVKHPKPELVQVTAAFTDDTLGVEVRDDDGVGGGGRTDGSGLLGLKDRVAALGGDLALETPPGSGTSVAARFPLQGRPA